MPTVFFISLAMVGGAILGLLLSFLLMFVYGDMETVVRYYFAGPALGAVLGGAYGFYYLRTPRPPDA